MNQVNSEAQLIYDTQETRYQCLGNWSISSIDSLLDKLTKTALPESSSLSINGQKITHFDSAGALCLMRCVDFLREKGKTVELTGFSEQQQALSDLLEKNRDNLDKKPPMRERDPLLVRTGKETIAKFKQADGFIILLGDLCSHVFYALGNWQRFQFPSLVSVVYSAGIQALPILALLSFLIGVVLAYQMGLQLKSYGANIYIAYLSGLAIFREFAPLITAIIVAGRTSSSFTAQIGSMKINEEIDALDTMGLSPTELLIMPKVLGLMLVFPLLIFWADIFSIFGAMFMSQSMLDVNYIDFLGRLKESVGLKQLLLGLYKAPVFAVIIALVGCFQGFQVQANAGSIGSQTTRSVVQALFMIIIADATFSILYSWLGL